MRAVALAATVSTGSGGTTKTLVQIVAGTNHALQVTEVGISFNGIDNLAEPIQVELLRQSTTGTASSLTVKKVTEEDSNSIDGSAQEVFTVEPTAGDVIRRWLIHPQGGLIYNPPDPKEFKVSGGNRLAIRTIMPSGATAVTAAPYIEFEE